jgi:predicted acetyltransferase
VYFQKRHWEEGFPQFWVRELVALTTDAYLNLIAHLLRHDLAGEIRLAASPDDPFLSVVEEAQRVKIESEYDVMLRIVDVEAALRMRALANPEHDLAFTMTVADGAAGWNDGGYRIEVAGGQTNIERMEGPGDLSLSAATLAPIFNGYLSIRSARLGGLVTVTNETAVESAEVFFSTLFPPFCADGF